MCVVFAVVFVLMDCFKEGGSTSIPLMLDGTNYACWKARMRAFLKAIDEHVWSDVVDGWTPLIVKDGEETKKKHLLEWTTTEIEKGKLEL